MFKGKFSKIAGAIFLLGAIGGTTYYATKKEEPVSYITDLVTKGKIEDTVLATGIIHPFQKVEVGSQVTGQIKKIHVAINQRVKAGDLLVEIKSDTQRDNLKDAEYNLANYKAQLELQTVSLEKAELRHKRQLQMLKADATSQEEVDDARISFEQAKAAISETKTRIKQAENSLNTAKTNLEYTTIKSPIDGVVVSIPISVGQTINASQQSPTVVQIAQVDTVTVKPEIAEADIIKVKTGMPVYFNVLGDTSKIYHSELKSIDIGPTTLSDQGKTLLHQNTNAGVYYYGSFNYPNEDNNLRMSMSAQVSIVVNKVDDVLTVPNDVIKQIGKKKIVTILKNGVKEEVEVETGLSNNIMTEIKSGLNEGDEIILTEGKAPVGPIRRPRVM